MIRIYTFADKRPDFIPLQLAGIKAFFPPDTSYTVFNNGETEEQRENIRLEVAALQNQPEDFVTQTPQLFDLPPEAMDHSNPNAACAVPLNWAWQNVIAKINHPDDILMVLDSDMFVVAPFDPIEYMTGYQISGTFQKRGKAKYIWNGIMIFGKLSEKHLKEFDFGYGEVEGSLTDVGGKTHDKLKQIHISRIQNIYHTSHIHPVNKNMHCMPERLLKIYDPEFRMEIYAEVFLHYGRGSNWDKQSEDYHHRKTIFLNQAINTSLFRHDTFKPHGYVFSENEWEK